MAELNRKLNDVFHGFVVRKDLVKLVKGNTSVPSYVLEYLLGQNCIAEDEEGIKAGVQRVKDILAEHYVQRDQAMAIRSDIKISGYKKVIDKVSVILNEKRDVHEASFENLGISKVVIDSDTVRKNRRLLVSGVWCIAELGYTPNEAKDESPYYLKSLKPIQMPRFSFDDYVARRSKFTTDEWIDVLIRSIGLDPAMLGRRAKFFQLTRLIPYCERNYNLIELGPKGTGKSHVYSELSPHGILISGGEVTPAKLFFNNSTKKIGLVGYWDCVAFDEFAGKNKRPKADIVDIMKNYMANKSFSRGVEQETAEASMVFVGNTSHDVSYMIKRTDLFEDLPAVYYDPAFIDRLHAYIPGWEMDIIRGEMFSSDYGFIVDYLAEALRDMRRHDYSGVYRERFEFSDTLSTRDRDGVQKTYAGLMKILYPGKNATVEEEAEIIEFALELRKRVKDSLYRIDETFDYVDFAWREIDGDWHKVLTLEEVSYPASYYLRNRNGEAPSMATDPQQLADSSQVEVAPSESISVTAASVEAAAAVHEVLAIECDRAFRENQRGVSYDDLFGPYFEGASSIKIIDPYVRKFDQSRNLMELLETVIRRYDPTMVDVVKVHLLTCSHELGPEKQNEWFGEIADSVELQGIDFTWEFDETRTIHARHVYIDDRWDITLDRGLDIWQTFDFKNAFAVENRVQETRKVKKFEIRYKKLD